MNKSILILAIVISYTISYYEVKDLMRDYDTSMTIINEHFENKENKIERSDGEAVPASSQVMPSEEGRNQVVIGNSSSPEEIGEFSAYTSEVGQTDSSPFTMASGKRVYDGAIANNCLEFGSKVEINGKVYTVEDRMNRRYGCEHFDIWMVDKEDALSFGLRQLEYLIINNK